MKKRTGLLIGLLFLIAISSVGAYAFYTDSATMNVSFHAASLKLGQVTTIPANLGDNVKPGDSGSFVVNVNNIGTIPGNYTVKIVENSNFLVFEKIEMVGVVAEGSNVPVKFKWSIPFETDMGTGGQELKVKISVALEQIKP